MTSRLLVLGLVGLGLSLIASSNACDPRSDECSASRCDGNSAVECETPPDGRAYEDEHACPSDTKCFVATSLPQLGNDTAVCGRLEPDGTSCPVGEQGCSGSGVRLCAAGQDGKNYWLELSCADFARGGSSAMTCHIKDDRSGVVCAL